MLVFYRTNRLMRISFVFATATMVVVSFAFPALADTIDSSDQYSWGENIGWLVWGTTEGAVVVPDSATDGELTGYVWGENVGWISLNCSNTSSCGTVDYSVDRDQGNITGHAWGENVGWINFNCSNDSSCGTVDFGTSIATSSGEFSGYAWGENVGWIVMNCSTTSSCGTVDYKVTANPSATATPTASPTPTPGGGVVPPPPAPTPPPTPSATPTPTASPTPTPTPTTTPFVSPPPFSPPPVAPPGPPPSVPGIPGFVDDVGQRLDRAADFIGRLAEQPVESGAGAATAVALAPILWGAVQLVQTKSAGAAAFEFLHIFGLKKRPRVWGTVYDARTKHAIPFAKVRIFDEANRLLETRFADRDGRYGFLLGTEGTQDVARKVKVIATRDGFEFPSRLVKPGADYLVYEHPYFGEFIEVTGQTSVTYDIPMDPVVFEGKPARPPFAAVISKTWQNVLNVGFYAGLVLVPYNMILHTSTTNFVIGGVFFGANAFRVFKMYRPYGHVKEMTSGQTVPFSLVTLHDQEGKRLAFSVSDEEGRYFISTQGEQDYQIRVHTPANMIPPRSTTEDIPSDSKDIKQGWITKKLNV